MKFDREIFFDAVRDNLFGNLDQGQVDGMNAILLAWELKAGDEDLRWLSYCLATTMHETASTMLPIEEYGFGEGQPYGEPDPVTGEKYYGRGFVQLTHAGNYQRVDTELGYEGEASFYWHPINALDLIPAARVMFLGMRDGWFRSGHTLPRYFSATEDDPYQAREIINGDKHYTPEWADGQSIGNLIADYHHEFLAALQARWTSRKRVRRQGRVRRPSHAQATHRQLASSSRPPSDRCWSRRTTRRR